MQEASDLQEDNIMPGEPKTVLVNGVDIEDQMFVVKRKIQ